MIVGFQKPPRPEQYRFRRMLAQIGNSLWKAITVTLLVIAGVFILKLCAPWFETMTETLK